MLTAKQTVWEGNAITSQMLKQLTSSADECFTALSIFLCDVSSLRLFKYKSSNVGA